MTIICPCCGEEICDEFRRCPECRFDIEQYNKEQSADLKLAMLNSGKEAYSKTLEARKERDRLEERKRDEKRQREELRQREENEKQSVSGSNNGSWVDAICNRLPNKVKMILGWVFIAWCVLSCVRGCGSSEETSSSVKRIIEEASQASSNRTSERITIKGFYIGMPQDDALSIAISLGKKHGLTFEKCDVKSGGMYALNDQSIPHLYLWIKNGTLDSVSFMCVDKLFGAGSMGSREFAQAIINNYNVPSMQGSIDSSYGGVTTSYKYEGQDGIYVTVSGTHNEVFGEHVSLDFGRVKRRFD